MFRIGLCFAVCILGLSSTKPATAQTPFVRGDCNGDGVACGIDPTPDNLRSYVSFAPCALAPVAAFTFTPLAGGAPVTVTFDASDSSDPDGSITDDAWNFGDGETNTGIRRSHVYRYPGTYSVRLTVTDNDGVSANIPVLNEMSIPYDPVLVPNGPNNFIVTIQNLPLLMTFILNDTGLAEYLRTRSFVAERMLKGTAKRMQTTSPIPRLDRTRIPPEQLPPFAMPRNAR